MRLGPASLCASLVFASLSSLVGCGAASDAVDVATESKTATLHGTWRASDQEQRPASIVFEQSALSVRATITMQGHRCAEHSVIEAKVTTDGVEAKATVGKMVLHLSGDAELSEIIGDYEALSDGPCAGERGWLTVKR